MSNGFLMGYMTSEIIIATVCKVHVVKLEDRMLTRGLTTRGNNGDNINKQMSSAIPALLIIEAKTFKKMMATRLAVPITRTAGVGYKHRAKARIKAVATSKLGRLVCGTKEHFSTSRATNPSDGVGKITLAVYKQTTRDFDKTW